MLSVCNIKTKAMHNICRTPSKPCECRHLNRKNNNNTSTAVAAHAWPKWILCFTLKYQRHNHISIVLNIFVGLALSFSSFIQFGRSCLMCALNVMFSDLYIAQCTCMSGYEYVKMLHCKSPNEEKNSRTCKMNRWAGVIKMKWTSIHTEERAKNQPRRWTKKSRLISTINCR